MPECTFGKDEFLIAAASSYEGRFVIYQFAPLGEKIGDTVHDSLYDRDQLIAEVMGVELVYDDVYDSQMYAKINNTIRSGDDTYSLVLGSLARVALDMFNNDLLYDLNEVPHIDLSAPWWNKNSISNFEINGKIYMATGSITNRYIYSPYAMLFNRDLIEAESMNNPYELLETGEWTMETLARMIEETYLDLNANDVVDINDYFGLAPASDSELAYYFAAGATMLEATDDGLVYTYAEEENTMVLEEVIALYNSNNVLKYIDNYDSITAFREGRAIFHSMALCDITMLNEMEDRYGIIPMPKYDEHQEEYYSNANRYIGTMALLPSSIVDITNVGLVVEAMASVSHYTALDKQYEQVLLSRQALDAQSKQSLITVVESTTYDLCYAFDFEHMTTSIRSIINKGGTYSSFYASYKDSLNAALEAFLERFE
jgi:hypothetical protein